MKFDAYVWHCVLHGTHKMLQIFSELLILQIIHTSHIHIYIINKYIYIYIYICVCVRACYGRPVHSNDVEWVPFSHGVAHSHVVGVGDGLQIWNVDVKIPNKQWRTANKGWSFSSAGVLSSLTLQYDVLHEAWDVKGFYGTI